LAKDLSRARLYLPAYRLEKIDRYKKEGDKLRSLAAGLLLARFLGVRQDEDLIIEPYGKPVLRAKTGPFFSLSHSGDYAALAIGPSPLGLDLERDRPDLKWPIIVAQILTPFELHLMSTYPNPPKFALAAFTLKESLAKATGAGLSGGALTLNVMTATDPIFFKGQKWSLGHYLVGDYNLALSVQEPGGLQFFEVQDLIDNPLLTPLTPQIIFPLAL
jgi:phosphopantetheinyl transferase